MSKARNAEYYNLQPVFDELYERSKRNAPFYKLTDQMIREANIKLAFRNFKRNSGSKTKGTDRSSR